MIDGVDDDEPRRLELARLATGVRAHVNLIPLNPTPGYPVRGPPGADRGVPVDPRTAAARTSPSGRPRSFNIDAACGQLAAAGAGTQPSPAHVELRGR